MFYYRCKYVLDFYIVLFLSMLSQAVVFNKIFNLLYKQHVFIHLFSSEQSIYCDFTVKSKIIIQGDYKQGQQSPVPNVQTCVVLFS